jgi:hypothetical protein
VNFPCGILKIWTVAVDRDRGGRDRDRDGGGDRGGRDRDGCGNSDNENSEMVRMVEMVREMVDTRNCKGTSVHFLTSPLLSHSPPVHVYSPSSPLYHFQGPYLNPMTFQKSTH